MPVYWSLGVAHAKKVSWGWMAVWAKTGKIYLVCDYLQWPCGLRGFLELAAERVREKMSNVSQAPCFRSSLGAPVHSSAPSLSGLTGQAGPGVASGNDRSA